MIFAISGFQGSGKDTIGNYLVEHHGFVKMSFAAALKDALAAIFGWDRAMLEGDTEASRAWREEVDEWWSSELNMPGFSPRMAMQLVGTNLFRDRFHPGIWLLSEKRALISLGEKNVVITDCRFPNEMEMLRELGAELIHVYRDQVTPTWFHDFKYGSTTEADLTKLGVHPSEYMWSIESHNHIIENNGTLPELFAKVDNFIDYTI